ncbi:MAG: hypothetical protein R3E95_02460 [Thiolinea sp.]
MSTYRQKWQQAEARAQHGNLKTNSGRRAANSWLQQGAPGLIGRQAGEKPPLMEGTG